MNEYNFESLSDIEFEEFSKDVLCDVLNIDFKTFRTGRDKGIDLLFEECETKIIVQVKHYCNSSFSNLKKAMQDEYEKMKVQDPSRYILFTSMDLSVSQTTQLIRIMNGYIQNPQDIFDKKKINGIISKPQFSWIEDKYYKLWLASTNVLTRIMHNAQHNNIEYKVKEIYSEYKYYVLTKEFDNAYKMLDKDGIILIHGEPGAGKTVMANMLVMKYLDSGYALKFISGNRLSELEVILSPDAKEKEVVFIDDFLGSNFLELMNVNTENKLTFFINKHIRNGNKKIVLTTRTSILNKSVNLFEKWKRLQVRIPNVLLTSRSYDLLDRAKILYNHCYHNLPQEYFQEISADKRYIEIINHKNYNPRIIEHITDPFRLKSIHIEKYYSLIQDLLKNPQTIWAHEFSTKIGDIERLVIDTLLSFRGHIGDYFLKSAFEERYTHEINHNNFKREYNAYSNSIEVLANSFIKVNIIYGESEGISHHFVNPSIVDFLKSHYACNYNEIKRIISSIHFVDQLYFLDLFTDDQDSLVVSSELYESITSMFLNKYTILKEIERSKLITLYEYMKKNMISDRRLDELILSHCIKIFEDIENAESRDISAIFNILIDSESSKPYMSYLIEKMESLLDRLIGEITFIDELVDLIQILLRYRRDLFVACLSNSRHSDVLVEFFTTDFDAYVEDQMSEHFDFTDYIEIVRPHGDYEFDQKSIENDIDDFISGYSDYVIDELFCGFFEVDSEINAINDILSKVEYDEFIYLEKITDYFEDVMNDYDYDYEHQSRGVSAISAYELVVDMFEDHMK